MFLQPHHQRTRDKTTATATVPKWLDVPVPHAIVDLLMKAINDYGQPIAINLWGVEYLFGMARTARLTLYFKHPGVLRNLLLFRDRIFLTECWLNNFFEFDGPVEAMIEFAEFLSDYHFAPGQAMKAFASAMTLPSLSRAELEWQHHAETVRRAGSNQSDIQHHYDVGNDFYKLFLDPLMIYSCAHFERQDVTLAEAQMAKLDLICRKLRLQPGETLLDVGCGWGALMRWAVRNYGVTAYGITLSKAQLEYSRHLAAEEGLEDRVRTELLDYRSLPRHLKFDKICSVGMIEHVGIKNYPAYFSNLLNNLKPGGLFLCHGITTAGKSNRNTFSGKFVQRYIFPGGELANLPELIESARSAGWESVDVDAWRPHYARTLKCWSDNLYANMDEAIAVAGERVTKLWLLYMSASARGFEYNWLQIYQVLLRRSDDVLWNLPMNRQNWLV